MTTKKRVLYISQEVFPFLPASSVSSNVKSLAQNTQESGKEIRVFMPRYGLVNERRNQLHEVIRLSGMNMVVNDVDHPLIIKVASIPSAKMQVYFIDNEEFFKRKAKFNDENGNFFKDNDERSIFFIRGVLETVKKLGWIPDIIHCNGWMASLLPLYIKTYFANDPHFENVKVVTSIYNDVYKGDLSDNLETKLNFDGIESDKFPHLAKSPVFENLIKTAIDNSDGVVINEEGVSSDLIEYAKTQDVEFLDAVYDAESYPLVQAFYDKIIESEAVLAE